MIAVALLGLTAFQVHQTEKFTGTHQSIIVELLVSAILTILWAPFAMLMLSKDRFNDILGSPRVHHEMIGVAILWILYLVGAAFTTNRILPGRNFCAIPGSKQCSILTSILALSWTEWSLLSILLVLALLNNAALTGAVAPTAATREKRTNQVA